MKCLFHQNICKTETFEIKIITIYTQQILIIYLVIY